MRTLRIIVCALLCVVFYAAAAVAAGTSDFHGFTMGMTKEQGDAEAKKQGLEVHDLDTSMVTYNGTIFGLPKHVLNASYEDGKLAEMTVILWAKSGGSTGFSEKFLKAKGKEVLADFTKKYGKYTTKVNEAIDITTHTWNLPDKSTLQLKIDQDDSSFTIFIYGEVIPPVSKTNP